MKTDHKFLDYTTKLAQEAGEYIGTMQFLSMYIEKGDIDLSQVKKVIDDKLSEWQTPKIKGDNNGTR